MANITLLRSTLVSPLGLAREFARIRNVLAGRASGTTLDQSLMSQLVDILLCKMHDEQTTPPGDAVAFQLQDGETAEEMASRLSALFDEVRGRPDVGALFAESESLSLDADLLAEVVEVLQPYELTNARRDVIGEAFEAFMGPSLRGNEGQFFTPRNVVDLTCQLVNPRPGEVVLDPACGTGGYLTQALRHPSDGEPTVLGVDKDCFLARVAAVQIGLLRRETESWAYCANSLDHPHEWPAPLRRRVAPGTVDVIMTNPPFGSKISVGGHLLDQYHLGRVWKSNKKTGRWDQLPKSAANRPPQVLFVERCLDLLKPGGRLALVLPDGVLGNKSAGYVRAFARSVADVVGVVDLPLETFLPSTSTKTSLLLLRKRHPDAVQEEVFMGIAETCGHDRRGNPVTLADGSPDDHLPVLGQRFREWSRVHASDF